MRYFWFTLIISSILLSDSLLKAEPLILQPTMNGIDLTEGALAWIAPPSLEFADPCGIDPECTAIHPSQIKLRHGFGGVKKGQEALYLRRVVFNPDDEPRRYIITLLWPQIESLFLVTVHNGKRKVKHSHWMTPLIDREIPTRLLNLTVSIPPGETVLLARIDGEAFLKGNLKIWDIPSLEYYLIKERLFVWALVGIFLALILSYLSIYLTSRDQIFLWPAFSLFFFLIFEIHLRNYSLEFLNAIGSSLTYYPFKYIFVSCILAAAGFCKIIKLLDNIKSFKPQFARIVDYLFIAMLISIIPGLMLEQKWGRYIIYAANLSILPCVFYHAHWALGQKLLPIHFSLITWIPFVFGNSLYFAQLFGFLEANLFFELGLLWGFGFLSLALGVSLGRRNLTLNRERQAALVHQESIKASLEVARIVQESLLPHREIDGFSTFHYYKPAESVGGDSFYYDASSDYIFISIYDVTGHGISAAIMTGNIAGALKKTFQYECHTLDQPEEILVRIANSLNAIILEYNRYQKSHLATMSLGFIDIKTMTFYFLNAGHIASYLIKETKVVTIMTPGSPLGLRPDPLFLVKRFDMDESDKLLFLTDGIIENITENGLPIKEVTLLKKLRKLSSLDPVAIGQELDRFLNQKFEGTRLEDDMTFLILGKSISEHQRQMQQDLNSTSSMNSGVANF